VTGSADWVRWHDDYDDPESNLSRRLRIVQTRIREWLSAPDDRDRHILSMCAGQGRDVLPVVAESRATGLQLTLVEYDASNVQRAQDSARALGVDVDIRRADAGAARTYAGLPRADLLLACGIFGNIGDGDIHRTVQALPQLCNQAATVVWTRSRRAPDLTTDIRAWFTQAGFAELSFDAPDDALFSVGTCRLLAEPQPLAEDRRWFTFLR
jgi:Putative methyltransferase